MLNNLISGFSTTRDGTPADNVIAVGTATLSVILANDVLNYRVETPPTANDILPVIALNNQNDLLSFEILNANVPDTAEVSLGNIVTPSGTHVILVVFDEATNTDFIFPIGGAPLTFPTTVAGFNALENSISGGGTATSGPFTPNTDIPTSSFLNTTQVASDIIFGTTGNDLLDGTPDADMIDGLAGNDTLRGLGGNDDLLGGPGADSIEGGDGNDVADGNDGDDILRGQNGNDDLAGDAGNDLVEGNAGDDTLFGDAGNDTLLGGDGNDQLQGGPGDDLLNPGDNAGGATGFDDIFQESGNDTISFTDLLTGFVSVNYSGLSAPIAVNVDGAANTGSVSKGINGFDTLTDVANVLNSGFTTGGLNLRGTNGDDTFSLAPDTDQWMSVRGGPGNDSFNISGNGLVRLEYHGGGPIDANLVDGTITHDGFTDTLSGAHPWEIRASDFNDTILGSDADESFILREGTDDLDGGAGFDRVRYDRSGVDGAINADLATGLITGSWGGNAFSHMVSNIENVRGSGFADTIVGDGQANLLEGGGADDTLRGADGDDTLRGDGGNDTAVLGIARADAAVSQTQGGIQLVSSEGTDLFFSIENFQFSDTLVSATDLVDGGGIEGDTILGTDGNDTLDGTINDDVVSGGDGNDVINGGGGNDVISASTGNDLVDGGTGNDSLGGGLGDDTLLGGDGNDVLGSGQGDDSASGDNGADIVNGGAGNDFLEGGEGNDTIGAGFNSDIVRGNGGDDSLGGGTGRDDVAGGDGNDAIGGGEGNDTINGDAGNDFLAGGGRNDVINGGDGDDRINGGDGDDTMTGGAGADSFVFNFFNDGDVDVITDFEDGIDGFRIRVISTITGQPNIDNGGNGKQGFVDALNITDTVDGAQLNVDGHLITVENVAAADLGLDDFTFL